eukprot:Blabericola_migrator_1__1629@NODE_1437_length_4551_cov_80_907672_g376_i1_p1_GENE_NODE_1437_length_4551_cov_80_907672_g376_i1NODE_1437_length_4551_cov_80_907672_g376_i1_p1_ORF_typecomplete_len848_score159_11PAP_central/PF04928_17/2_8e07NTP_transf_2/PF01909_23/0_00012Polbeta/PF18765_1/9_7e03Polbeta/PF18765_1/0_0033PAP_assoc/PF03828_19/0_55_NODE_1437_length_4551_cov_80_907672_g376_i1732544
MATDDWDSEDTFSLPPLVEDIVDLDVHCEIDLSEALGYKDDAPEDLFRSLMRETLWIEKFAVDPSCPPELPSSVDEWQDNVGLLISTAIEGDVSMYLTRVCSLTDGDNDLFWDVFQAQYGQLSLSNRQSVLKQINNSAQVIYNNIQSIEHFTLIRWHVYQMAELLLVDQTAVNRRTIDTIIQSLWYFNLFHCDDFGERFESHTHVKFLKNLNTCLQQLSYSRNTVFERMLHSVRLSTTILSYNTQSDCDSTSVSSDVSPSISTSHRTRAPQAWRPTEPQEKSFIHFITKQERLTVLHMKKRVKNFIEQTAGLKVYVYGSMFTGLVSAHSDIDLTLKLSEVLEAQSGQFFPPKTDEEETYVKKEILRWLYVQLREMTEIKEHIWRVQFLDARVPIIKIREIKDEDKQSISEDDCPAMSLDLSISKELWGVRNSTLLKHYAALDDRLHPLVAIVKYWTKCRFINGAYYGYLSSFGYTLSIIHYLQTVTPPVLPNIQTPSNRDFEAVEKCLNEDRMNFDLLNTLQENERLPEKPEVFNKITDWRDLVWWGHFKSKNTQSVLELLRGYFEFMALTMRHEAYVISPRCAPNVLAKIDLFINNNAVLYPRKVAAKAKKKKKKKGQNASAEVPEADSHPEYLLPAEFPLQYHSLYKWKYCHEEHSAQKYIQEMSTIPQFYKIMVEDPVEGGRFLQPFRSRTHAQTLVEFVRAFWIMQAGFELDKLFETWLPLDFASLTPDTDKLEYLRYEIAVQHGGEKPKADTIVTITRADILCDMMAACDAGLMVPMDFELADDESLSTFWDRKRSQTLVQAWRQAELSFMAQYKIIT